MPSPFTLPEHTRKRWGRNICKHRKRAGMTQAALAAKVGVSYPTVYRWEVGETAPSEVRRPKIAKALEVEVSVLFPIGAGK